MWLLWLCCRLASLLRFPVRSLSAPREMPRAASQELLQPEFPQALLGGLALPVPSALWELSGLLGLLVPPAPGLQVELPPAPEPEWRPPGKA